MERRLKVGILGLGAMGSHHGRSIIEGAVPGMRLAAVCDSREEILADWGKLDGISCFRDVSRFFACGIEAVIVATPHVSHVELGIAALRAGLHTLVEKPIAVHKADAETLLAVAEEESALFGVMLNQRTNPTYCYLKKVIENRELGEIHRISWTVTDWYRTQSYYASGGWRATWAGEGGGVLLNQCPHQLDLYQWLFGMPKRVRSICQMGRHHAIEVEDSATALFEHENGAIGVFSATTGEAPGLNRLEVAADRGLLVLDENGLKWLRNDVPVGEHLEMEASYFDKPKTALITFRHDDAGEQHVGILRNFANACLRGDTLIAPGADGLNSLELANAILLASGEDRFVDLPLDGPTYERWLQDKIETSSNSGSTDRQRASR